jgi:flagellar secretion chaperone FliS
MAAPFKNPYQQTQITTASPEKILLLLYDGAINNCRRALEAIDSQDVATKGVCIGKAVAIVGELMNTLNHDIGGEISQNLEQLYVFVLNELTRANIERRAQSLHDSIKVLSILREAWTEAIELQKNERIGETAAGQLMAAGGSHG